MTNEERLQYLKQGIAGVQAGVYPPEQLDELLQTVVKSVGSDLDVMLQPLKDQHLADLGATKQSLQDQLDSINIELGE